MDFTDYLTVIEDQNRAESHALLHFYADHLKKQGFAVKAVALRGDPRDELVRKIKEVRADALVMGCRGLGVIKRTFLGSLSGNLLFDKFNNIEYVRTSTSILVVLLDYCIHHIECPVIIVKHPHPETVPQYGSNFDPKRIQQQQPQQTGKSYQQPSRPGGLQSHHETTLGSSAEIQIPPSALGH
jgi:Universal stress protein family